MKLLRTVLSVSAFISLSLFGGTGKVPHVPTPYEADAIVASEMLAKEVEAANRKAKLERVEALEEWEINRGGRMVILRRTAPPPLASQARLDSSGPKLSEEQKARQLTLLPERRVITLSAYVHDRATTEVIWRDADGIQWRVISNVDFNYLNGIGSFSDGSYVWSTVLLLENIDSAAEQMRTLLSATNGIGYTPRIAPDSTLFSSVEPEYLVYAESETSVPKALYEEMDALHQHYQANKERLIAEYERGQVLHEARQKWHEANPPEPRDAVINFWRVK